MLRAIKLTIPAQNTVTLLSVGTEQKFLLTFPLDAAVFERFDEDLEIGFHDGGRIILQDYFVDRAAHTFASFILHDGTYVAGDILLGQLNADMDLQPTAGGAVAPLSEGSGFTVFSDDAPPLVSGIARLGLAGPETWESVENALVLPARADWAANGESRDAAMGAAMTAEAFSGDMVGNDTHGGAVYGGPWSAVPGDGQGEIPFAGALATLGGILDYSVDGRRSGASVDALLEGGQPVLPETVSGEDTRAPAGIVPNMGQNSVFDAGDTILFEEQLLTLQLLTNL